MSFLPTRASPQIPRSHLTRIPPPTRPPQPSDTSYSSTTSVLSLAALSKTDLDIIDSIIARAPPAATSFLAVFKAYNDVLQERGLDAGQDVLYYRFLLKLGVLRGTWGERWKSLRNSGQDDGGDADHQHDHDDDDETTTEVDEFRDDPVTPRPQQDFRARLPHPPTHTDISPPRRAQPPSSTAKPLPLVRGRPNVKSAQDLARAPSSRPINPTPNSRGDGVPRGSSSSPSVGPPSYRTYPPEPVERAKTPSASLLNRVERTSNASMPRTQPVAIVVPPSRTLAEFAEAAAKAGKLKLPTVTAAGKRNPPAGSSGAINADETWKILRMEAEADDFRLYYLVKNCWDIWLSGLNWYQRRAEQVDLARSHVTLRHALGVWHTRHQHYQDLARRADNVSHTLLKRAAWKQYRLAFFANRRKRWQEDMKQRLGHIRNKIETRMMTDAFLLWYRRHQTIIADRRHRSSLLRRTVQSWALRLSHVDAISETADRVMETRERMVLERAVDYWKRRCRMRKSETTLVGRFDARILVNAWNVWRNNAELNRMAQQERRYWILKAALQKWRKTTAQTRAMERRADHYVHRQGLILVRAVMRIWCAKERGALLERVRRSRLLGASLIQWKAKMVMIQDLDGRFALFTDDRRRSLLNRAFERWRVSQEFLLTSSRIADQHLALQVGSQVLATWRTSTAMKQRTMKQARVARRWFVMRQAFKSWKLVAEERKRQKKLEQYEAHVAGKVFRTWRTAAQKQRHNHFLVLAFQEKTEIRISSQALAYWLNRVVERKSLELQVSDERDATLVRSAFERWKTVHQRHKDGMDLMQSYHDVKREDLIRRTFLRWLASTRKSAQRKRRLEQRTEEQRQMVLARAWDTWRDRFKERELAPVERQLRTQMDLNILFRGFRIWESRTMSVPALRFFSLNIKAKAWNQWRDALPRAKREREARELDHNSLLSKVLVRWKEAYRSKIQLKSIARARNLRLAVVPTPRSTYRRPSASGGTRPFPSTSAVARVAGLARQSSPERPPSLLTQVQDRDSSDELILAPRPPRSVRSERPAYSGNRAGRSGSIVLPQSTSVPAPKSVRTAPASEAGARGRIGRPIDDDAASEVGSAKTSPGKAPNALVQRAYALAANDSPGTSRDRLRLELRAAASRRSGL